MLNLLRIKNECLYYRHLIVNNKRIDAEKECADSTVASAGFSYQLVPDQSAHARLNG